MLFERYHLSIFLKDACYIFDFGKNRRFIEFLCKRLNLYHIYFVGKNEEIKLLI